MGHFDASESAEAGGDANAAAAIGTNAERAAAGHQQSAFASAGTARGSRGVKSMCCSAVDRIRTVVYHQSLRNIRAGEWNCA